MIMAQEAHDTEDVSNLFHIKVADRNQTNELLEKLAGITDVEVISVESNDFQADYDNEVLTPEIAKGLEYYSVCVLNPGQLLRKLETESPEGADAIKLEEYARRSTIDRLRVALSRATDTLAFIDIIDDVEKNKYDPSQELLGKAETYDPDELIEHFDDTSPEEQAYALIERSQAFLDAGEPIQTWLRVQRLAKILEGPKLQYGTDEAWKAILKYSAHFLIDVRASDITRDDVVNTGRKATAALDSELISDAFEELNTWSLEQEKPPFTLLDIALALDNDADWLKNVLSDATQTIRQTLEIAASKPTEARWFAGDVEGWLKWLGVIDPTEDAEKWRQAAVRVLFDHKDKKGVEEVLLNKINREKEMVEKL